MIVFDHVSKRYPGGQAALRDVSFSVERSEMVFITGHSGAGKSTLLRLIASIESPTSGTITVNGRDLARLSGRHIANHRRDVGVIFQNPTLLKEQTVFDNVALPLRVVGLGSSDIQRRVRAALDQVGLLDRQDALPTSLSGGEQQRVGIARAIVGRPPVVLADEPTGNLDASLSSNIMDLLVGLNRTGVTILVATHDRVLIRDLPHRRLHLEVGLLNEQIPLVVPGE